MLRREYLSSGVNVLTNSLKIWDVTKADIFPNSIYREFMEKVENSGAVPTSAVFRPVNTLITEWCAEARPFRRLSKHLFRIQ